MNSVATPSSSISSSTANIMALFPGQGSQKVGMGKSLCDTSPIARDLFARADQALGFSISKLCFEGPENELTMTAHAQPAILTVSTICFQLASAAGHLPIVAAAGHSLGEYSALVAAGVIEFEDAVRVVNLRGRFMQEAVPVGTGKMIAVLGKEVVELEAAAKGISTGIVEVANVNAPGQIVVSGAVNAVDAFIAALGPAKIIPLPVSAPFHCALMQPAAERLATELAKITFNNARFPVIQNVNAQPESNGSKIRSNLIAQVCGRVRWVECIENGIAQFHPQRFVEFGTGTALTGMAKRINSSVARANVEDLTSAAALFAA